MRLRRRGKGRAVTEATMARRRAELDLQAAQDRLAAARAETPKHRALGESLRRLREENHFAAAFRHSIQGGKP